MADSVARQPRQKHSLVHQLVSSLQTSPERISEPNHNEEVEKLLQPTEIERNLLHSKRRRAEDLDAIPESKSWAIRRCTRQRAINSVACWLESIWGSELGSCQERRSLSDSIQNHSAPDYFGDIHIPPKCTSSAPAEGGIRDTGNFLQAPTSHLAGSSWNGGGHDCHCDNCSCSRSATPEDASEASTMSNRQSLVESPRYRSHLGENGIELLPSYISLPEHISDFVTHLWKYRNPTGPSESQIQLDTELACLREGIAEGGVASYFQKHLFLTPEPLDGLKCSFKLPMARHAVPGVDSKLRVSVPVPDIIYGYSLRDAFTKEEQSKMNFMTSSVFVNNEDLSFPFLAIEQKGDGPASRGSLWVATNQCLGASASCVNIVERFNQQLRKSSSSNSNNNNSDDVQLVSSISFSIAMNGSEARLYVTWKQAEIAYHTAIVDSFLLQRPADFLNFRRYVLNILDWGMRGRLTAIQASLGHLLEESKETSLRRDMDRSSPSEEQDGGRTRKRRRGYRRRDVGDTGSSIDPLTL
ncbi:hypothetical protein V491_01118 [Pseudogymnoascus sp. VKM F-3775]|nr:hypothetical protein V491_01118 [Pseudogymnoascus sp. VKM F-3775]